MDRLTPLSSTHTLYVDVYGGDENNTGKSATSPFLTINKAVSAIAFHSGSANWEVCVFTTEKPAKGYTNCTYTIYDSLYITNKYLTIRGYPVCQLIDKPGYESYDAPHFIFDGAILQVSSGSAVTLDFMHITFKGGDENGSIRSRAMARLSISNSDIAFNGCVCCITATDSSYTRINDSCSFFIENCTGTALYTSSFAGLLIGVKEDSSTEIITSGSALAVASWGAHLFIYRLRARIKSSSGKRVVSASTGGIVSIGSVDVTDYSTTNAVKTYSVTTGGRFFLGTQASPGT